MKNLFTLLCMFLLASAGYAQEANRMILRSDQIRIDALQALPPITETEPSSPILNRSTDVPNGTPMIDAVTSFKIGEASNAFTFIAQDNNQIVTAPGIGTGGGSVAFLYRHNIGECGGTTFDNGRFRYSISNDGGLNWNVGGGVSVNSAAGAPSGHCFGLGTINPAYTFRSRYPNLAFFANGGATPTVDDLDLVYVGAVLTAGAIGGGASWDGNVHGLIDSASATTDFAVSQEDYLDQGGDQFISLSLVERIPGEYWYVNQTGDGAGNNTAGIILNKGAYDAGDDEIKWSKAKTLALDLNPYYLATVPTTPRPQIAFSPDGTTGYVAFLGDLKDPTIDSVYTVITMESTDGGATWSDPEEFNMNQFPELIEQINFFTDSVGNPLGTGNPTVAFDFDLVVDANNNPHIFSLVGNGTNYSIQSGLKMSVFDFTKDQFGDWNMAFIADQGTFRGTFGVAPDDVTADPWFQATRSPDGNVVYCIWTDTDTVGNFGTSDNLNPNLLARAMDVNSFLLSDVKNYTFDDANWAGRVLMPKTSPVSLVTGNTHTIPTVVMDMPGNNDDPVFFWYFSDVTFDAGTDFTNPAEFFYNCNQNPFANGINILQPDCGVGNGALSITATGGITPYTYLWDAAAGASVNDSVTGLSAGIYSVTVTDSAGCTDVQEIVLNNVGAPVLAIDPTSVSNISCAGANDGAATVTATGGAGGNIYAWGNGESLASAVALLPGSNTVTVTDANGCASFSSVEIVAPSALFAQLDSNDVTCAAAADGTVSVLGSGGTGIISYLWDDPSTSTLPVVSGLGAGTYTVTLTDANSCTTSASITVNEPAPLTIGSSSTPNLNSSPPFTGTATASATGGTGPYDYAWSYSTLNDACDSTGTTTASGAFIFLLRAGDYFLTVTDANECVTRDTVAVTGEGCVPDVGIDEELAAGISALNLFPNPNNGSFTVEMTLEERDDVRLSIMDARGKLIQSRRTDNVTQFEEEFNLDTLPAGVYLLRVETSKGTAARRLVVQ